MSKRIELACVMVVLQGLAASVAMPQGSMPVGLVLGDTGDLDWYGLRFSVQHYDSQWNTARQSTDLRPDQGYPKREQAKWELRGSFRTWVGPLAYQQAVRLLQGDVVEYEASVHSPDGVASNGLSLTIGLPVGYYAGEQIVVDGQAVRLPEDHSEQFVVLASSPASKLQIATEDGQIIIEGSLMILVQDNREFHNDFFQIRLDFAPSQGLIKESSLKLTLRYAPDGPAAQPVEAGTTTRPAGGR